MRDSLQRLLRPKSIAVFGGNWADSVVEQCVKIGYEGKLWPVHPRKTDTHGVPCHRSVDDLPDAPDASFIGVNRHLTIDILGQLAARGAGGAVCFASGFSEVQMLTGDGEDLQHALVDAAGDMALLGPNCYGLINYLDGALLWPDQHGGSQLDEGERGVAIVMQSSNIAINITMQARGLPIAYLVCTGNQAQTDSAAIVHGLLDDERVSALGLHIEGIKDIHAFESMALAARQVGKPVIALKVGQSESARQATLSHTASLAGSEAGSRAFFQQLGIPLCRSLPEFLETLKLLHVHGPLPGRAISSMSCSGGEASLIADIAMNFDLDFRPLTKAQAARVGGTLNELVTVTNPLDYHTFIWNDEAALTATYSAMIGNGFDLNFLVSDFPRADRCSDASWQASVSAIKTAARRTGERVAVISTLSENLSEDYAREFMQAGIAPLAGMTEALAATEAAASIGQAWAADVPTLWAPAPMVDNQRSHLLDEPAAKKMLAVFSIDVPNGLIASSGAEATAHAKTLGVPVVLKAIGLAHKTDVNAVRVGLARDEDIERAANELLTLSDHVLVEEMVANAVTEMIVGVHLDPVYGHLLTIGAGGVLTEILDDKVTLRMPASADLLRAKMNELRIAKLLVGHRNQPRADVDAVIDCAMNLQRFTRARRGELLELDVNPLIVRAEGQGALAVDVLIRLCG